MDMNDKLLRRLLIDAALEKAEEEKREFKPSDRFKTTLNKNIKANGIKPYYSFLSIKRHRALVITAAVIAAFALSMSVGAIRERVVSFFIEMFDTFAVITTDKNNDYPDKIEDCYAPAYIPEGYEIINVQEEYRRVSIELQNENSDTIFINQFCQGVENLIDSERRIEYVNIFGEDDGIIWESQGARGLYFEFESYFFTIISKPELDENVLVNIAKSLEKVELTKN